MNQQLESEDKGMGLLSSIGDAVGGAIDAATDVVSDVAEGVGDAVGGAESALTGMVGDTFESITDSLGPIGDVFDGAMDVLSAGSFGSMLNAGLDKLGMPDWIGDIGGGVLDFCTGNFVGAAANGLDALEDVAKACGGDELAGYLKAGSQVTGMFAGGPGAIGGKAGQLIDTAQDSVGMIDDAMGVAGSFADGDILGAGDGLLELVGGDLGPLTSQFGDLSDQALGALDDVVPNARGLLGGIGNALEDGQLTIDDLGELPLGDLASQVGAEIPEEILDQIGGPITDFVAQADQDISGALDDLQEVLDPAKMLNKSVFDAVKNAAEMLPEDVAGLDAKQEMIDGLLELSLGNPVGADMLRDLLDQAASIRDDVDITEHHCANMRA